MKTMQEAADLLSSSTPAVMGYKDITREARDNPKILMLAMKLGDLYDDDEQSLSEVIMAAIITGICVGMEMEKRD